MALWDFGKVLPKNWLAELGCCLVIFTLSECYLFENQVTYIASYIGCMKLQNDNSIRSEFPNFCGDRTVDAYHTNRRLFVLQSEAYESGLQLSSWAYTMFILAQAVGMSLGGHLEAATSSRWAMTIGVLMAAGGQVACYWCMDYLWAFFLLFGALQGVGVGLAYMPCIAVTDRWFPNTQFAMWLTVSAFSGGGLFWDPLQSELANARHYQVDSEIGFMNRSSVLTHTPSMFALSGCLYVVIAAFGILLITNPPIGNPPIAESPRRIIQHESVVFLPDSHLSEENERSPQRKTLASTTPILSSRRLLLPENDIIDMTLFEAMQTFRFWQLALIALTNLFGTYWIADSWKVFAAEDLDLTSDVYLSRVGAISAFASGFGRGLFCLLYDSPCLKQSIRWTFGMQQFVFATGFLLLPYLAGISKATGIPTGILFGIDMSVIYGGCAAPYVFFPTIVRRTFGGEYCSQICGFLFGFEGPAMVVASFMFVAIPQTIDWSTAQLVVAVANFIGTALIFVYSVEIGMGKKPSKQPPVADYHSIVKFSL